jgi:biotin operon repressor
MKHPITLSRRQEQCLRLQLTKSQADIARELGISHKTVHVHIARAAEKFGIDALSGDGQVHLLHASRAYFDSLTDQSAQPPSADRCTPAAPAPAVSSPES